MGQRSIAGSSELGKAIKLRRNELKLTIEEAASKAGVGMKTWSRYEAGESIRKDKYKGICRALNWYTLPGQTEDQEEGISIEGYKKHEAWSNFLADGYGETAALSFAVGSDILLDDLQEDMEGLSAMPRGTQIGQLEFSFLKASLPPQFLMKYDYDFLYLLQTTVNHFRLAARAGGQIIAHTVMEELALYLVMESSQSVIELSGVEVEDGWSDWVFDLFDDSDLLFFLYSGIYLEEDHPYHFNHWLERQFYCDQ